MRPAVSNFKYQRVVAYIPHALIFPAEDTNQNSGNTQAQAAAFVEAATKAASFLLTFFLKKSKRE